MKAKNMNNTDYFGRDIALNIRQTPEFKKAMPLFQQQLDNFLLFLINLYDIQKKTIDYDTDNLYISITKVSNAFNSTKFFSSRNSKYGSWVEFMDCLNFVLTEKLGLKSYDVWMIFIEYKQNPYMYDKEFYSNMTSPYTRLKFYKNDGVGTPNKEIFITGCEKSPIKMYFPVRIYGKFMDYINTNRLLFDPNEEKDYNDPIFKLPIFINSTGFVSQNTVEDRIKKYHRIYNFSCNYLETTTSSFKSQGLWVKNYSAGYISINTPHLTEFVVKMSDNPQTFLVDNDFFYITYYMLFFTGSNYTDNLAFYIITILLGYYIIMLIITSIFDSKLYKQEVLIEFIKSEVIRSFSPYEEPEGLPDNDIPFPDDIIAAGNDEEANNPKAIFIDPIEVNVRRKGDSEESRNNSQNSNDIYYEKPNVSDFSASRSESSVGVKIEEVNDSDLFGIRGLSEKPKDNNNNNNLDEIFPDDPNNFFDKGNNDFLANLNKRNENDLINDKKHRRKGLDFEQEKDTKEKTLRCKI